MVFKNITVMFSCIYHNMTYLAFTGILLDIGMVRAGSLLG